MNPSELSAIEKALSFVCHHCPVCSHARSHPDSFIGKLLHNPLHADHCPAWKAEQKAYPTSK
ncbi:MAG: hypothetical protein A2X36_11325 [Elusimicrobia bacterium GWA2_69_24]|nr:MAG: hypothetical protein A2X36_11325 [Elusimicrobia bacterium GWA2_69_24]HBL15287.1 hypothetical protein [Elusimicrobiota bacterium]